MLHRCGVFPLGVLLAFTVVLLGMMTAVLPVEVLPAFWADWIATWVPQPFIAGGLRDILYMGAELMPRGSGALLVHGVVGLALLVVAGFVPARAAKSAPVDAVPATA